jgi:hypothetical protein
VLVIKFRKSSIGYLQVQGSDTTMLIKDILIANKFLDPACFIATLLVCNFTNVAQGKGAGTVMV